MNEVDEYINKEKVITVNKLNIKEGDINNCIKIRGSDNLYYEKNLTRYIIKMNSLLKHLIYHNLSDVLKNKFDFQKLNIYQIWNIFKSSNTRSKLSIKIIIKYTKK